MKILITGSQGFVGKNLVAELKQGDLGQLMEFDLGTDPALLDEYCKEADFVFHLAGVNRPKDTAEFMEGNFGFTSELLACLKKHKNTCPLMISSSTQAALDNPYGQSKKAGEDLVFEYGNQSGADVLVYRLPNLFGKWSRPNYNSVIATFCHNISRDIPIKVNDPSTVLTLVYIDDLVEELLRALEGRASRQGKYCTVPVSHEVTLGKIVDLLENFKASRQTLAVPDMGDEFEKKLYATYLSFLPEDAFAYPLKMNVDDRGSFTEIIRTPERGQFSVNITKPGITKGNHWHHTKNEKFLVVAGEGVIRFRKLGSEKVIEYHVSGDKMEVVDIPPGYTHNIENTGQVDLVTFMWANEPFDPGKPDTWFLKV
ncbi:MAG: capsular polysaccharide biosynthesis protein CapF [Clostridiales bacterium]|nr:capsular polysaccharide biosynthesis protein CapF [Clostridiales bacterium]